MSNGTHVRPGEVISSSLINQILDRLDALEQSIPSSTNGNTGEGAIVIDGFDPATEQEVGRVLAILGSNLPFPAGGDTVTIGDVPAPEENLRLAPSNRERLELVVPEMGTLPAEGQNLFVRVSSGSSSAQRLYRILPSSGGVQTPSITAMRPLGGSAGDLIPMGSVAIIEGANFSDDSAANTITFTPLGFSPPADPYPRASGPPLDVQGTSNTEIRVVVPDMSEITVGMSTVRVRVEIAVDGAPDPATFEFFTFRA